LIALQKAESDSPGFLNTKPWLGVEKVDQHRLTRRIIALTNEI
jgi:hypothetical protein